MFETGYGYGYDYSFVSIFLRLLMIAAASGAGFAIGWLFSPHSAGFRKKALMIFAALFVAAAIFLNNFIGWNAAFILALVGFFWGVGYWFSGVMSGLFEMPTTFGSSRWASKEDVEDHGLFGTDGIRLGETAFGDGTQDIAYHGERHLLTVAPTRAGKGTTQIIPNLLTYGGSVLVIDPKGENAKITAKRRKDMGQEVHIVDPWNIVGLDDIEPARFNPLDWLDKADVDITENAMLLADALVVPDNHGDSFWTEEAKALLQGIILYVATDDREDGQRHLGRVRDLLLMDGENQKNFFKHMTSSPHHIVASTGARCLQKEPKLIANVIAAAQAQTHFLDSTRMRDSLGSSDFKFEDLKAKPMAVFLVLPADRLNAFGRWFRLLVQQSVTVNARNIDAKPDKPVLFILDEFAALGRLTMIEQAYGLMAGFGIQLWAIIQDLNQLERVYDKGWQSFIANAGMVNYFGSSDKMTSEYFSSMCGEKTVWNVSYAFSRAIGSSSGQGGGSSSTTTTNNDNIAAAQRKLIFPDELMRLKDRQQLVLVENMHPLMADKVRWFEHPDLKGLGVNLHKTKPSVSSAVASDSSSDISVEVEQ